MSGGDPAPMRPALPPAPEPGSARYFVLLYAPAAQRATLARLLALSDEIGAGVARGLDHDVAHARLDWWRHEAAQYAAGRAQHPWLRTSPSDAATTTPFDLSALVHAAALDLAQGLQSPTSGAQLRRALFVAAAEVLGAGPVSAQLRESLGDLGALSLPLERAATAPAGNVRTPNMQEVLNRLGASAQAKLAPLLVWAALAGRPAKNSSPLRAFTDNIRAWNVARRAAAGTFTSP
jgi:hypothetical protein